MNRLHVSPVENISTKEPLKRMSLRFAQDDGFVGDEWRVLAACKSGTAEGRTAGPSASPDFLSAMLASANFLRLSLLKAAHAVVSSAAWQEIRVRSG
jgi:hypothetical protein